MQAPAFSLLRSRVLALALGLALLGAQGLALLHAVEHGGSPAPGGASAVAEQAHEAHGLLAALVDHELGSADCLVLDHLAQGAPALALAVLAFALPAATAPQNRVAQAHAEAAPQPYQARAPPVPA